MDAFQLKDKLAEKLGEEESRELLSFISSRGGGEQAERLASLETSVKNIDNRLDKIEVRVDKVYDVHINTFRWMIGIGITLISITVGILFKVF